METKLDKKIKLTPQQQFTIAILAVTAIMLLLCIAVALQGKTQDNGQDPVPAAVVQADAEPDPADTDPGDISAGVPGEAESSVPTAVSEEPAAEEPAPEESTPKNEEPEPVKEHSDDPYPNLFAEPVEKTDDNTQKMVYLTFDDGPSENTEEILDILDEYNVKATFFVSGQFGTKEERAKRFKMILDAGHTIGLHSFTHSYQKIYASVDAFLSDMNDIYQEVYDATGYRASLLRFPGGSVNAYNQNIYQDLVKELDRRGLTYHDWAVSSGDAEGNNIPASTLIKNTVNGCLDRKKSVVLLHDTDAKDTTVEALPTIIKDLQDAGYELRALDDSIRPFQFAN